MLSDKQLDVFLFPYTSYDCLICDGSVRSGKTFAMVESFILWAMTTFDRQELIIMGKTVGSAKRNVIDPLLLDPTVPRLHKGEPERYAVKWLKTEGVLTVGYRGKVNRFHVFGAKDEASYQLVQGLTAAGLMVDETALCNQAAVNQAVARCSVEGSKLFFNCNPEGEQHWFYKEWILKAKERNALRIHFTMDDNPSLSSQTRERYERMFAGVFKRRYVLGEWVLAEGLVYPYERERIEADIEPKPGELCYVGLDYGITNPFAAVLLVVRHGVAYVADCMGWDSRKEGSRKTDSELHAMLSEWLKPYTVDCICIDPSASSFIEELDRHGDYEVVKANNGVLEGIQDVSTAFDNGALKVSPKCGDVFAELGAYRWDESRKDGKDHVIKESDHYLDALRYCIRTALRDVLPCFGW